MMIEMKIRKETKRTVVYEYVEPVDEGLDMKVPVTQVYVSKAWLSDHVTANGGWPPAIQLTVGVAK